MLYSYMYNLRTHNALKTGWSESILSHAVVIWSDMLGGVLIREESLPWSGPLHTRQIFGERRETG